MNYKLKKIFTNWKVILLLVCLILSVAAINPDFGSSGVSVTFIAKNSSIAIAGILPPKEGASPRSREIITSIETQRIENIDDYYDIMEDISKYGPNETILISTNKQEYSLITLPLFEIVITDELENVLVNVTEEVYDVASGTYVNKTIEKNITQNKTIENIIGIHDLGLRVKNAPSSNIRKGLDLEGGTRVILQPEEKITDDEFSLLLSNLKQRLNVYGLSDIIVRKSTDLLGTSYILVEIAGVNQEEVRELIANQGKFEAKISNTTVFSGGGDIKTVIRTADGSGIDPRRGCSMLPDTSWVCRFYFGIILSQEAAEKQAAETDKLDVVTVDQDGQVLQRENQYLSTQLNFYLDGQLTDSLNIGADLKGRAVTDIQISGSGHGNSELEARTNALKNMKSMQTILITGSLPVKLQVVKTDSISPILGKEFLNNALFMGLLAVIAVVSIIYIRYLRWEIVIPVIVTMLSELVLLLGFASAAGWNLDLAAMAAIIIVIGTGVDHQIIIADETLRKSVEQLTGLQKIKRAFSIILVAGLTTIGAMVPLMAAGAGILKGFALTTIVGVLIGILIARPAFSAMVQILLKD